MIDEDEYEVVYSLVPVGRRVIHLVVDMNWPNNHLSAFHNCGVWMYI